MSWKVFDENMGKIPDFCKAYIEDKLNHVTKRQGKN